MEKRRLARARPKRRWRGEGPGRALLRPVVALALLSVCAACAKPLLAIVEAPPPPRPSLAAEVEFSQVCPVAAACPALDALLAEVEAYWAVYWEQVGGESL